jgi:hypothetical protein
MKINNWKSNVSLLSVSEYANIYRSLSAQFERGELFLELGKVLNPISNVVLNYDYENDTMLSQKNSEWKYSLELDNWATSEFAKVKSVLAELREMKTPAYNNEMRIWENETNFLSALEMYCRLRSRVLLAHSYRVEQR